MVTLSIILVALLVFSDGTNSLSIQGFSVIDNLIEGGIGTDTLIFENLFLSADKIAELETLAAADTATGSVTIFGETFNWQDFEDIQVNNLQSLETLVGRTNTAFANTLTNGDITENIEIFDFVLALTNVTNEKSRNTIVDNVTGQDSTTFLANEARNFVQTQSRQLSSYFKNIRAGYTGFSSNVPRAYDLALPSHMQAGYSELFVDKNDQPVDVQSHFNDWSGFLQITGAKSEVSNNETDSETDSLIATLGLDHRINKGLLVGAYFGYSYDDANTDIFDSSLEVEGLNAGLYSHYRINDLFIEGSIGLRHLNYDQERNVALTTLTADSDFQGAQIQYGLAHWSRTVLR